MRCKMIFLTNEKLVEKLVDERVSQIKNEMDREKEIENLKAECSRLRMLYCELRDKNGELN